MKYITNREQFIHSYKYKEKINEASGPFENDIPWGDSLVGRLISTIGRKIGIGTNIVRIKPLIKKLNSEFDNILDSSYASELTDDQKSKIGLCLIYDILVNLENAIFYSKIKIGDEVKEIEDSEYLKEIERITYSSISEIQKIGDQYIVENEEEIVKNLNELISIIKNIRTDSTTDNVTDNDESLNIIVGKEYNCKNSKGTIIVKVLSKSREVRSPGSDKSWQGGKDEIKGSDDIYGDNIEYNIEKDEKQVFVINRPKNGIYTTEYVKGGGYSVLVSQLSPLTKEQEEELQNVDKDVVITPKTTHQMESIFSYNEFVYKINENDDPDNDEDGNENDDTSSKGQLKSFWTKNIRKHIKTKNEIEKINSEIGDIKGDKKSIVIKGIDPVIEIVKIFNRAYKIHTTSVIPGGRSNGKVSRGVWNEYDAFGYNGGEPNATTQGPYRNKKVFNIWENAVLDILKNRKYQPIFDPKTSLQVGKNKKEGAGSLLRKLITDFLDGEKLYKSGGRENGVQKEFLDKYFGEIAADEIKKSSLGFSRNELFENASLSDKIPSITLKFEKIKMPEKYHRYLFTMKSDSIKYYFFVQKSEENEDVLLVYSKKFTDFKKYIIYSIKKENNKLQPSFINLTDIIESDIFGTKISLNKFKDLLGGKEVNLTSYKYGNNIDYTMKFKGEELMWLINSKDSKIFKLKFFNYKESKSKGFSTDNNNEWGKTK